MPTCPLCTSDVAEDATSCPSCNSPLPNASNASGATALARLTTPELAVPALEVAIGLMIVSTVANAYSVSDRLSDQSSRWRLVLALVGGNLSVLAGALALGAAIGWVALRAETADRPDTHTGQMHAVLVAEVAVLLLVAIVGIFNVALPSDDALFNGTVANRFGTIAYEAAAVVLTTAALLVLGSARAATGARPTGA